MRSRAYRRDQRSRHITRKKNICNAHKIFATSAKGSVMYVSNIDLSRLVPMEWYDCDGKYSKGKIHCSCGICKYGKKFGLPTIRRVKEDIKFADALDDYLQAS